MNCLENLMHAGNTKDVYDNEGVSLMSESNLARLKSVPILFIHGTMNAVFDPESTEMSYNILRDAFDGDLENYERRTM
jgi:predicted esterase